MGNEDVEVKMSMDNFRQINLKILLLGEPKVGKTTFLNSLEGKPIPDKYYPTIGSNYLLYQNRESDDDYSLFVDLWEIAGNDLSSNFSRYCIGAHGLVVIYETISKNPVEDVRSWLDRYLFPSSLLSMNSNIPLLIIQNKSDLKNKTTNQRQHRKVLKMVETGYNDKFTILDYSISMKENIDLAEIFGQFIGNVLSSYMEGYGAVKKNFSELQPRFCISAYFLAFDMDYGPVIVEKVPGAEKLVVHLEELSYAVKLYSILDFEDLIKHGYRIGLAPWPIDDGSIYYISFVLENSEIRGGHDMFIIGATISNELSSLIQTHFDKLEGFLIHAMNELARHLHDFSAEIVFQDEFVSVTHNIENKKLLEDPLAKLQNCINGFFQMVLEIG